jgi:hypothetical protein
MFYEFLSNMRSLFFILQVPIDLVLIGALAAK